MLAIVGRLMHKLFHVFKIGRQNLQNREACTVFDEKAASKCNCRHHGMTLAIRHAVEDARRQDVTFDKRNDMRKYMNLTLRHRIVFAAVFLLAGVAMAGDEYKETEVKGGGTIKGRIRLEGKPPGAMVKTINKDEEICGKGERRYGVTEVYPGGGVKAAVAFLPDIGEGKSWPAEETVVVEQKACDFHPTSFVVRKGAKINLKNSDPVFHNAHGYELAGSSRVSLFNNAQLPGNALDQKIKTKRPASHAMKLECDVHNFMHGWLFVAQNPYFSPTADGGAFLIRDVPPGEHTLSAWHPALGTIEKKVKVEAGKPLEIELVFKP